MDERLTRSRWLCVIGSDRGGRGQEEEETLLEMEKISGSFTCIWYATRVHYGSQSFVMILHG